MSIENAIYALSNINAIMSSTANYVDNRQNGVPAGYALSDMGYNIMNGALRNEMSRDIQQRTGSYLGYAINNAAGYGNPVANAQGTSGTIAAAMLTSPFGIFGCNPWMMTSSLYGCGPFGGGYYGGFFPGCYDNFMFGGGPSMFGMRGCWC